MPAGMPQPPSDAPSAEPFPIVADRPPAREYSPPVIETTIAAAGTWLTWLQTAGSCTLSVALHVMVLVTLASWTLFFPPEEKIVPTLAAMADDEDVELTDLEDIQMEDAVEVDIQDMTDVPQAVIDKIVEKPDEAMTGDVADNIGLESMLGNLDGLYGQVGGGLAGNGNGGGMMREFKRRLKREGAMSGDVQISLIWEGYNDLDLHVLTPKGVEISWQNRTDRVGKLDVDMNAEKSSKEPVENVFWPEGKAPRGKYLVGVHHFATRGGPSSVPFQVAIKSDGKVETIKGVAVFGQPMQVVFTLTR